MVSEVSLRTRIVRARGAILTRKIREVPGPEVAWEGPKTAFPQLVPF